MVFWEMTSGISFSILYQCLVQQRTHALRQFTAAWSALFVAIDTPVVAQRQIPMVRFPEILHLQYIDKVVVMGRAGPAVRAQLWETVEIPQLRPFLGPGR